MIYISNFRCLSLTGRVHGSRQLKPYSKKLKLIFILRFSDHLMNRQVTFTVYHGVCDQQTEIFGRFQILMSNCDALKYFWEFFKEARFLISIAFETISNQGYSINDNDFRKHADDFHTVKIFVTFHFVTSLLLQIFLQKSSLKPRN